MSILGLVLDGAIILLLAVTIVFAARLSLSLKTFRDNRQAFEGLLRDLDARIGAAESTILGLRQAAQEGGQELQEKIDDAQNLHDELSLMTQAADNMARRLEQSASGGLRVNEQEPDIEEARVYDLDSKKSDNSGPQKFEERLRRIEEKESTEDAGFMSEAERDLAEALKGKAGTSRKGAGK